MEAHFADYTIIKMGTVIETAVAGWLVELVAAFVWGESQHFYLSFMYAK